MRDYVHGDKVGGDKIGRDKIVHSGHRGVIRVANSDTYQQAELQAAVEELQEFITELRRIGLVGPDGSIHEPAKVVNQVEKLPNRFTALRNAIAGGAKEAILAAVKDGVAGLIVALVGASAS